MNATEPELFKVSTPGGPAVPFRAFGADDLAAPAVVVWPAMGVAARHYGRLATALTRRGFHVLVGELRGVGDSPVRAGRAVDFGYGDLVEGEVAASVTAARARWPDSRVMLVGHSLGGQLALLYTARHPGDVGGVALATASTPFWRAYPPAFGLLILALAGLAPAVAAILGHFPGGRFGFGGREARRLITEWARTARTGRLPPVDGDRGPGDPLEGIARPVLSIVLAGDPLAPRTAADALIAAVPERRVARRNLPPTVFEEQVSHLGWLRDPNPVADEIAAWAESNRLARDSEGRSGTRGTDL